MTESVDPLDEITPDRPRISRRRRFALILTGVAALALAALWTQREPIARDFVQTELDKRGVQARYDIAAIGLRTQRIENLVLGDPEKPDLTAEWVEVITGVGLSGVTVREVRGGGIRLRGRLVDGSFQFGELDRLLPEPDGSPFALPDLRVVLEDARVRLDTPYGQFGAQIEGRGNLTDGFRGRLATVAPALDLGGCTIGQGTMWLELAIFDRRPRLSGPVRAASITCGGANIAKPEANIDARFSEALDSWSGSARLIAAHAAQAGQRIDGVSGTIGFEGAKARTKGKIQLLARTLGLDGAAGEGLSIEGAYQVRSSPKILALGLAGRAVVQRVEADARAIKGWASNAVGTPIGPIVEALAAAAERAAQEARIEADFTAAHAGGAGSLVVHRLDLDSTSGARVRLADGAGIGLVWPGNAALQVDGRLTLSGGGFPNADIRLNQPAPGAPIVGVAHISPYAAKGASIALEPVRFAAAGAATRFDTRITLDGPLGNGVVKGLTLPLSGTIVGTGAFAINPNCAPLQFSMLQSAGLALGPTRLTMCPHDGPAIVSRSVQSGLNGGVRIAAPRLSGRLGDSPITLAAADISFALRNAAISANAVAVRLGPSDSQTRLDISHIDGRSENGGLRGSFAGTAGQIANVPLLISEGAGHWSLKGSTFALEGGLSVADAQSDAPRFNPLVTDDFTLSFADGRIAAQGLLREPRSNAPVTTVSIAHRLADGTGKATLDVTKLRFDSQLQPDGLTPLALGVVANVYATVDGRGEIRWSPDAVTSDGVFRTENADLAAAFGPVTALSGELRFTDLLGLVSAPGQRVWLGEVNPGIAVINGQIDYQLIEGQRIKIEGGKWPFAGGELILEPAVLDFGERAERHLTFEVRGLDAGQFINQFEFKDVNLTGTFDGKIPMIFDSTGGRVENGRLVVRNEGGTLAYVGQVSNEQLGMFGSMAFDALKSIKYNRLAIDLNGPLDGEMVTEVRFAGINQGTVAVEASSLTRQFLGLPFIFNITIKAPFRGLFNTARGFTDPGLFIRQNLPGFEAADPPLPNAPQQSVQPKESETMP